MPRAWLGAALAALAVGASGPGLPAQDLPEVRQIVTFKLQATAVEPVVNLYEGGLRRIYEELPPLLRFRAYRETESPEPLDLVVVSSYRGMAGMDAANEQLRAHQREGESAFAIYQQINRFAVSHHDQFVEMIDVLGDPWNLEASSEPRQLTVFEYLRLTPGTHSFFEELLQLRVRPFEQGRELYRWSETGRVIVGDGWDYLRTFGVDSLGMWHEYVRQMRDADFHQALTPVVVARKTIILRREPRLSLR
jgi:hypothetical protein